MTLFFRSILLSLFVILAAVVNGQESKLAQQYFQTGEYEKASTLYEKLYKGTKQNDYYFNRYIESLIYLEEYDNAEAIIRKMLKEKPDAVQYYVTLGNLYERQFRPEDAEVEYRRAIDNLGSNISNVSRLGSSFIRLTKYDLAIETYERGALLVDRPEMYAYNLADLYRRKGNVPRMLHYYLNTANQQPNRITQLKTTFQKSLSDDDHTELQKQLYTRMQEDAENIHYPELLEWSFLQRKQYRKAFTQARALDRKYQENGVRVFNLGTIAKNDKDFNTAIEAFEYVIETKGVNSPYYIDSKKDLLDSKRRKITQSINYTKEDLTSLEIEYETFLDEFGRNRQTGLVMYEYAEMEALYINNIPKAMSILDNLVTIPGLQKYVKANAKIALGDYHLIGGSIWEATLLYSQVDKDFKEEFIGEKARFRNAQLSYYNGDFEWAQAQFDILKASTSKLISNDAIDMSVFIMDNLGLDTTTIAMEMYAASALLIYQHKYDEAIVKLDSIEMLFPEHSLADDILYSRARIHYQKREYNLAEVNYQKIIDNFQEEIRCDNAINELAGLYEDQGELVKAKDLYEKLFLDHPDSTLAVDARKRFRVLRGDDLQ